MIKIQKRSNLTRSAERPPVVIPPADPALLAELHQMAVQSGRKSSGPLRSSRSGGPANSPGSKPAGQPAALRSTPAQPQNRLPEAQSPEKGRFTPSYQNRPGSGPAAGRFGSETRSSTGYQASSGPAQKPAGQNSPQNNGINANASQQPDAKRSEIIRPANDQPVKSAAPTNPPPSRYPPANPVGSKQPAVKGTDPQRSTAQPAENGASAIRASQNGSPQNGGEHRKDTGTHLPPQNGAGTHSKTSQPSSVNGSGGNGAVRRPSLFSPENFTSASSTRTPNRPVGPVQIPMEIIGPAENGKHLADDGPANEPSQDAPQPQPGRAADQLGRGEMGREADRLISEPVRPRQAVPVNPNSVPPDLDRIFKQHPDLPDQTALLGVCEDGLPILLDLNDPNPGAAVVIGDERAAQLKMLRTAVASLARRNSPRQVQFLILSCEPQVWQTWVTENGLDRYSIAIESAEDEIIREWVLRLADWTEQRRLGERSGPAVLVVMDTLSFLPRLEYDVRLNFEWMAKEGPLARVWPLAAISTDLAKALSGRRLLRAFKTRILGFATRPEDYSQLMNLPEQVASEFKKPGQFAVQVGEAWLRFRLPG